MHGHATQEETISATEEETVQSLAGQDPAEAAKTESLSVGNDNGFITPTEGVFLSQ